VVVVVLLLLDLQPGVSLLQVEFADFWEFFWQNIFSFEDTLLILKGI
jgi:hypothetical protein